MATTWRADDNFAARAEFEAKRDLLSDQLQRESNSLGLASHMAADYWQPPHTDVAALERTMVSAMIEAVYGNQTDQPRERFAAVADAKRVFEQATTLVEAARQERERILQAVDSEGTAVLWRRQVD